MTAERIAILRASLIAQSTGDQAEERNELCDLAEEALRLRAALRSIAQCQNDGPCGTCRAVARAALAKAAR